MRALEALLLVVGTATAHAHPVGMLKDPFGPRYDASCDVSKTWTKVTACLARQGQRVSIVREVDGAKLVALRYGSATDATLGLYLLEGGRWTRQAFYASSNATSELLAFRKTTERGYRMDVGTVLSTSVQLDDVSPTKAVMRRVLTTECRPQKGCRTVITSCDVYVEGKAYWFFHGQPAWKSDGAVRVAGDTRFAGTLCMPPRTMIAPLDEVFGDPLE